MTSLIIQWTLKIIDRRLIMDNILIDTECIDNELLRRESLLNDEFIIIDSVENNELVYSISVTNNVHFYSESVIKNEPFYSERVMNNEHVYSKPVITDDDFVPIDTLPFDDSEIHIGIIERQSYHTETQPENPDIQPTKLGKKKSIVWEHFTMKTVSPGCRRASCKQCKRSFAYSTGSKVLGTSHLKRHIAKGACLGILRNQKKNEKPEIRPPPTTGIFFETPKQRRSPESVPSLVAFDSERCRHEISQMIIMHDYSLHIVEHPGFCALIQSLQPGFDIASLGSVQGDCMATYLTEKQSLQKVINMIPGRICLTLDLWSSSRTVGYMFVSAQFIDCNWEIHQKLLNVIVEPCPESDTAFSQSVAACLSDWGINGKLFSVTINQSLSGPAIDNLRTLVSVKNTMVLKGQLSVGSCLASSLNRIVQDALTFNYGVVKKIRDSVKYVRTSESQEKKILEFTQHLEVPSLKTPAIDDQTQWNTTYEMLVAALEWKELFSFMATSDPDYKNAPSTEDWIQLETLCACFKPLFNTANILMKSTTPTTNMFFLEAWKIHMELASIASGEDPILKLIRDKFEEYWENCCFALAIAAVVDPRFKMKLVEFSFTKIHGDETAALYVKIVEKGIHELFLEYVALPLPLTPEFADEINGATSEEEDPQGMGISSNGLGLTDFDVYIMESSSHNQKSELDRYLEDSVLPRVSNFDVIGWWKKNKTKYPTLSNMARDILSMPVSSVPTASVFDTGCREMDSYMTSLCPETVQALICAKDWLKLRRRNN